MVNIEEVVSEELVPNSCKEISAVVPLQNLGSEHVRFLKPEDGFVSMFFFCEGLICKELEFLRELEKAFRNIKMQSQFQFIGKFEGSSGLSIAYQTEQYFANWKALSLKHEKVYKIKIKQVFDLHDLISDIEGLKHGEHVDNNYYEAWYFDTKDPIGGKVIYNNDLNK